VVTTDRGLYRSADAGKSWALIIDNLPAHLEAGPLVRDPLDPATLYAGFALVPYSELWRRAADREGAFARVSVPSLAGGAILLLLVVLGAFAALRRLENYYRPPTGSAPATRTPDTTGWGRRCYDASSDRALAHMAGVGCYRGCGGVWGSRLVPPPLVWFPPF